MVLLNIKKQQTTKTKQKKPNKTPTKQYNYDGDEEPLSRFSRIIFNHLGDWKPGTQLLLLLIFIIIVIII